MEYTIEQTAPGLAATLWNWLLIGLAIIAAGYAGTLWQLSRDQAATIAEYKAFGEHMTVDCAAAKLVAECGATNPFGTCSTTAPVVKNAR
jgi:hypothetical protein